MESADRPSGITLPELLGAFSLAIDLGLGQPMEHVLRSWRVAARLGDAMGLAEDQRDSLFHIAMLSWVGCVADAPEVANWFGDDIAFRADSYDVELASLPGVGFFLGHAGRGGSVPTRVRKVASIVARGGLPVLRGIQSHCAATSLMAARLGLSPEVCTALGQFFTRWDGRGVPFGVGGEEIALTVRLIHLADVVEVRHRSAGVAGAVAVARARRGGQFDPRLVDAFCTMAEEVLPPLDDGAEPYDLILAEPSLRLPLTDAALDQALGVVADFTDLRSTSRAGHSSAVATLASDAARILRLGADDVVTLRRAALVHDIGLHGVPASILDKGEPLTRTERELLMMSSYYTHRVLARPPSLARIGAVASLAHERMDGSGHHRGLTGSAIPMTGRVLAAADAYRSLLEPREGRPALSSRQAVDALRSHVRAGRLDADAADAVLVAAGSATRRPVAGPAGLTRREVEVLRLIAGGATTTQVASAIGVTRRTAGTHIERIYAKTGASSRSTATLFALRAGLLGPGTVVGTGVVGPGTVVGTGTQPPEA